MKSDQKKSNYTTDLKLAFRALRHRNYRLFFFGQGISLIGTWMQQIAMSWLIYRLTNSPFMLGAVGFVGQMPVFILTPLAGVLADRHNRKNMVILAQLAAMIQAFILAFLVLTNQIQVWHLFVMNVFLGVIASFDIPIRQAFTVEMIENREDLGNAIALNSSLLNATRLIGPSVAGLLIAFMGEGICFLLNAVSYIPALFCLWIMKIHSPAALPSTRNLIWEFKDGWDYTVRFVPIRWILLLLSLISLLGVSYHVLMPVFARDIFHGGPNTLGFLMGMSGTGALAGALYLAMRKSVIGLSGIIGKMAGFFGVSMILFAFSTNFWFSLIILTISSFGMMVHMAASNTVLQTIVEEDKRGRVMSFYTVAFLGTMPFGSLLAGALATWVGAPLTLFFCGVSCILGSLIFLKKLPLIREKIRPIYRQKGIIPEVAQGIQSAAVLGNLPPD